MSGLPSYMRIGRGAMGGPIVGPYITVDFGSITYAVAGATNTVIAAYALPFGFRVEAVSWSLRTSGHADDAFKLSYGDDPTVATGTTFLSSEVDVNATPTGIARVSGTTYTVNSGARGSTADVSRNIDRLDSAGAQQYLVLDVTTGAAVGALTDLYVSVCGFIYDHVNIDPSED